MKKIMILILSLIVLMSFSVLASEPENNLNNLKVISPNGGETLTIGETYLIKWNLNLDMISTNYRLGIFLEDGPTPGNIALVTLTTPNGGGEYKWKIQDYIFQGDVGVLLESGKYKLKLILYDGVPCLGFCLAPDQVPQPKIIATDKSDNYFNIVSETNECVKEEGVCGGIMGLRCCDGLMCEITDKYQTDATGICVKETPNKPPVIIGVSGPTNLEVNEMGKWKIEAYDPDGKYLKYSVDWGENVIYPGSEASNREVNQEATFTHSYSQPGTYKVVFIVTDEKGANVQSSISVNVGKTSILCEACIDGKPTGKYDGNGCMIYECLTLTGCNAMIPYCPDGELIRTGFNEAGCNIWKCVSEKECNLEPEQGPCKARFVKFYFDKNEGICKQFIWGGCEGIVPFDTLEECRDSCESELTEGKECPQLGYREDGQYCSINYVWEEQRNGGEFCNNDFECSSNSCLDSQCTEPGFWIRLTNWLAKFFGQF